ncbi:MAG: potassium transporter, partial [Candidatus Lambdaproteobacteria bacterium RIFOXYC1_FULL_56_13]
MPHLEFSALTLLLTQIGVILLATRSLGLAVRWIGQPLVIAEVLAGILLGPSLLGLVWPGVLESLFPAASMSLLKMFAQLGLVLFMFLVGLELDPKLLKGHTRSSIAISHTSIVTPFALGSLAGWFLYDRYSSPEVSPVSFILFFGISLSVTAFPVLARILSERHLLSTPLGAVTLACAAVDDVTAWCLLAFVVSVARAHALSEAIWTTGLALGFILIMLYGVRPLFARVANRIGSAEALTQTVVSAILLLLLASACTTELIGIHALFGAFMFGAILPKTGRMAETLAGKIETVTVILLLPLFFAFSGLRTQIGLLSAPQEWVVTLGIILIASLGKFGGSLLAARLTGFGWREGSALGILMNTRGLMELIVLNIALDLGIISSTLFTMLVIMALVTTFATTPLLHWVYPDQRFARQQPLEPELKAKESLLICISDSASGPALARIAKALTGTKKTATRLFALHLWNPSNRPSTELLRNEPEQISKPLVSLVEEAKALDLPIQTMSYQSTEPALDICHTAKAQQASLVLLGSHKPLLLEGKLGGVVSEVIRKCGSPVAVLMDRGLARIERVLIAYAGGPEDLAALKIARQIATSPGAQLTLLHVVPPGKMEQTGKGRIQAEEVFPDVELSSKILRTLVVESTSPPDAVLEEVAKGYDLIILGVTA